MAGRMDRIRLGEGKPLLLISNPITQQANNWTAPNSETPIQLVESRLGVGPLSRFETAQRVR